MGDVALPVSGDSDKSGEAGRSMRERALKKLLRRAESKELLAIVCLVGHIRFRVRDLSGGLIFESHPGEEIDEEQRSPIPVEGVPTGFLVGTKGSSLVADFLAQMVELDGDRRALVSEALLRYKELNLLYSFAGRIASRPHSTGEVAGLVIDKARSLIPGEHYCVFVVRPGGSGLDILATGDSDEIDGERYRSLMLGATDVLSTGKAEIRNHESPDRGLVSSLLVPIKAQDRVIGVLATDRSAEEFSSEALKLATALSLIGGMAMENARHVEVMRRFVPRDFLNFLGRESITSVQLGDQAEYEMSVLFCDIRSFTTLVEGLDPAESFEFVNEFLECVGPVIREHGGFVDKYAGDSIMAIFSGPADAAIEAGIDLQRTIAEFSARRSRRWGMPIEIGVGIHTGRLMLGIVGEQERWSGTVISDAVNVASRVEELTRTFGATILVTGATLAAAESPDNFARRMLGTMHVKGKSDAVQVHEIFELDPAEIKEIKRATRAEFEEALTDLADGQTELALSKLQGLAEANPQDEVLVRCVERLGSE